MTSPEDGPNTTAELMLSNSSPETQTKAEYSLIDRYIHLYTKGVELPDGGGPIVAVHKKSEEDSCKIIIGYGQHAPLFSVEFNRGSRKYSFHRREDGEIQYATGSDRRLEDSVKPESLLEELEDFFGVLDSEELLRSYFTTMDYRRSVLGGSAAFGSIVDQGAGTKANTGDEDIEFYEGYEPEHFGVPLGADKTASRTTDDEVFKSQSEHEEMLRKVDEQARSIIDSKGLTESFLGAVKQVLTGRIIGLSERAIYRQLAKMYHPDIANEEAGDVFKIIVGKFYSDDGGFCL